MTCFRILGRKLCSSSGSSSVFSPSSLTLPLSTPCTRSLSSYTAALIALLLGTVGLGRHRSGQGDGAFDFPLGLGSAHSRQQRAPLIPPIPPPKAVYVSPTLVASQEELGVERRGDGHDASVLGDREVSPFSGKTRSSSRRRRCRAWAAALDRIDQDPGVHGFRRQGDRVGLVAVVLVGWCVADQEEDLGDAQ